MGYRIEGPLTEAEKKDLEEGYYILTQGAFGPWMEETAKWYERRIGEDRKELAEAVRDLDSAFQDFDYWKSSFLEKYNAGKLTTLVSLEEEQSEMQSYYSPIQDRMEEVIRVMDAVRGGIDYLKEHFPAEYKEWAKDQLVIETTGIRPKLR